MREDIETPGKFLKTLLMDFPLWVLIISHLSVVGLVWFDGWHPLILLWIYIFQQISHSLIDMLIILINPILDTTGFISGGKPVTDSKSDRRDSAFFILIFTSFIMGPCIFMYYGLGMGIPPGTLPLILTSTMIFTFQRLFSYFYFRFMEGPSPFNVGCAVVGYPIMNMIFLMVLVFTGFFLFGLFPNDDPQSLPHVIFLGLFIFLKLSFDAIIYITQKYGSNSPPQTTSPESMTPKE